MTSKFISLSAVAVTSDRIDLSWPAVTSAVAYYVYRSKGRKPVAVTDRNLAAITSATQHQDRDLLAGTDYRYLVVAVDGDRNSLGAQMAGCRTLAAGLTLTTGGPELTIRGDAFEVTWNRDLGGEITAIRQYDGNGWFRVNADEPKTTPALTFTDKSNRDHRAAETRAAEFKIEKQTPAEIVFSTSTTINGISVGCRYFVFEEGAVFGELSLPQREVKKDQTQGMASEESKQILDQISLKLGLQLSPELLRTKFRWGCYERGVKPAHVWKSAVDSIADDHQLMPIGSADYGLNERCSFTNHLEFLLEDSPPEGASSRFGNDGRGGFGFQWSVAGDALRKLYFLPWDMGFLRTRWGLLLGATRTSRHGKATPARQNNLVGARIFHAASGQGVTGPLRDQWPFNVPPVNQIKKPYGGLPSDRTIARAKKAGASVMVMHQSWMRSGGSNCEPPADYIPRDPKDLKRFVQTCHKHGLRVALYMRGTEQHALFQPYFEQFLKRDFDGLYVDWSTPLATGYGGSSELHFSAYAYFLFTRAMRERVGPNGFLIAHSGGLPTLLSFATFDAYLPGEFATQKKNFLNSIDEAVYHGYLNSTGSNPICTHSPRGVAFNAALGLCPHFFFDDMKNGPEKNLMEDVWRILGSVPVESSRVYNSKTENFLAVESSNLNVHASVYKVDRNTLLLIATNLGERGEATLTLNMAGLGLTGEYRVGEVGKKDRAIGTTADGQIRTEPLEPNEYVGYRLERIGAVAAPRGLKSMRQ